MNQSAEADRKKEVEAFAELLLFHIVMLSLTKGSHGGGNTGSVLWYVWPHWACFPWPQKPHIQNSISSTDLCDHIQAKQWACY